MLSTLVEAGALAACWSGAGPTLIGFVTADSVEAVRAGAGAALAEAGMEGRVLSLRPDRRGLVYGEEAEVPLEGSGLAAQRAVELLHVRAQLRDRPVQVERVEHLVVVRLGGLGVAEDLEAVGERLRRVARG